MAPPPKADNPAIGLTAFVPVGMSEVSSCLIDPAIKPGYHVGKGEELGAVLLEGLPMAEAEEGTVRWYAFKISETRYGALDVFESEEGRQAHLSGEMAERLREVGGDLFGARSIGIGHDELVDQWVVANHSGVRGADTTHPDEPDSHPSLSPSLYRRPGPPRVTTDVWQSVGNLFVTSRVCPNMFTFG